MPTYDFKCWVCEATREVFIYHKDYETYVVRCDTIDCYNEMQRIISAPAIKFNGSGFYSTGG